MSDFVQQANDAKEDAQREIVRVLNEFQAKTGLAVSVLSHIKSSEYTPLRPAKILSVQLSAELPT